MDGGGQRRIPEGGDLNVVNISELHPVRDPGTARSGERQGDTGVIRDAAVAIRGGRIAAFGPAEEVDLGDPGIAVLDARRGTVAPGLVESHAHPIFAGNRSPEYARRLRGMPASILGDSEETGIKYTVRETRRASTEELTKRLVAYLERAAASGVTTCEVKGGYGLTLEEELRYLSIAASVADPRLPRVVATLAAAHDVPHGATAERHTADLLERILPSALAEFPAAINDVTCEQGVFTPEQTGSILAAARRLGARSKVHADAFADSGGWDTAVEHGALSADHLTFTPIEAIERHAGVRTVATVLPVAELFYMTSRRAPARAFIEHDVPLAVATDYCSSIGATSLQRAMALAAPWFGLGPEESLTAVTLNAAYALGVEAECGSIDIGKRGDLVVFSQPTLADVFWAEPDPPAVVINGIQMR